MSEQHDVLIIGGGTAGITVAAQLLQQAAAPNVTIVDPSTSVSWSGGSSRELDCAAPAGSRSATSPRRGVCR